MDRPFSDHSYEAYLNDEKIMGSRCKHCDTLFLPPRPICIKCHKNEMEWVQFEGEGKLTGFTSIVVCPKPMTEQGYGRNNPYCVGVVRLKEGVKIVGRLEGVDARNPESIKIGTPLKAGFLRIKEGELLKTFLTFRPF